LGIYNLATKKQAYIFGDMIENFDSLISSNQHFITNLCSESEMNQGKFFLFPNTDDMKRAIISHFKYFEEQFNFARCKKIFKDYMKIGVE
jgi:hypothetical protein